MSTIHLTIDNKFKSLMVSEQIDYWNAKPKIYYETAYTKGGKSKKKEILGKFKHKSMRSFWIDATGVYDDTQTNLILPKADALEYSRLIDKYHMQAHGDVKQNKEWLAMYGQDTAAQIAIIDSDGNPITKTMTAIPCHNCGIVLPKELIQVDHHMPQADGQFLYTLKTLRALGLTIRKATGWKGKNHSFAWGVIEITPRGRNFGDTEHLDSSSHRDKWTPTDKGLAFLSLCEEALIYGISTLSEACMNSMLNLVPLCPRCNLSKSDFYKRIK